jgi:hypothetical protein
MLVLCFEFEGSFGSGQVATSKRLFLILDTDFVSCGLKTYLVERLEDD